jgi:hypothetical protein
MTISKRTRDVIAIIIAILITLAAGIYLLVFDNSTSVTPNF